RRPPEDHGRKPLLGEHPPDRTVGGDEVVLAYHVREALGAEAVSKGVGRGLGEAGGLEEIAHGRKCRAERHGGEGAGKRRGDTRANEPWAANISIYPHPSRAGA